MVSRKICLRIFFLLFPAAVFFSCQKEETNEDPVPGIEIFGIPTGDAVGVYPYGDSIPVKLIIKYPKGLHDYVIEIQELPSYEHVFAINEHTHDPIEVIDTFLILPHDTIYKNYRLRARVLTHEGTFDADSAFFSAGPF